MIPALVYILCGVTSFSCSALLFYRWERTTRVNLLLYCAICFLGLGFNSVLLFLDLVVMPGYDLSVIRLVPAFFGIAALIYGLVKEHTS